MSSDFVSGTSMKVLLDSVCWNAREHPVRSRGTVSAGVELPVRQPDAHEDVIEECCVLTRNPRVLFFSLPRSKVFHPQLPFPSGILWWRAVDETLLPSLHATTLEICSEVGLTEFCFMCHAQGSAARRYWQEMLGEQFSHLRWRL
jgi:hypothetical protein